MSRIGWRACKGIELQPGNFEVAPLYPTGLKRTCLVGKPLTGTHHVGTSKQFVIDYYAEITDLAEGEHELLLELECPNVEPGHEDRWECPAPTEALAINPIVKSISILATGPRE